MISTVEASCDGDASSCANLQAPKADLAKERTSYVMRKKQEQE